MSVLLYGLSYPHYIDGISLSLLDFRPPKQIYLPFLLIDESCTNTISKLRVNHMQYMLF